MQKYRNRKVRIGSREYASQKEANRRQMLLLLQKAGKISELREQVTYELIPTIREPDTFGPRGGVRKGKVIERGVSYIADFVYKDESGCEIVEDTKGFRTKDYIIKRKLFLWRYGIRIKEV